MIDGAFVTSKLVMPQELPSRVVSAACWGDLPLNRILVVVSALLVLVYLAETMRIFPAMMGCLSRWHFCISFEHSLSLANARNTFAAITTLPFCLIVSRYSLYRPSMAQNVPEQYFSLFILGVVIIYLLTRLLIFKAFGFRKLHGDEKAAVHNTFFTCLCVGTSFLVVTISLFLAFKIPESTLRTILYVETAVFAANAFLKEGQILASRYGVFPTFLYLCALEILPVALLTASAVLL